MQVIHSYQNILWLPQPNKISEVLTAKLPPIQQITTVFGLVMDKNYVLVAHLYRGWDLPGGHIEKGENVLETLQREIWEETKVTIKQPRLIGYQKIEVYAEKPDNYRYPYPESYQVHYMAEAEEIGEFTADEETKGRDFITYERARQLPNLQHALGFLRYAMRKEDSTF